jgi:N12 class adenine-specific DNA methylase
MAAAPEAVLLAWSMLLMHASKVGQPVFIDEAHYFKNLETPTKMDRVAGIQTGGSERAFDVYMKARYLGEQHPGHGVTFATGTPISNTMMEMYTMQRFLDPEGLKSRGLEHFDAWAATFGEVIDTMEISPDGTYRN